MCCRSNFDGTIEAAGRNLEQCAIHLDIRERRPAFNAETALVPSARQPKNFDFSLSGYPMERCVSREEIGAMGRAASLSAPRTMAEEEAAEGAIDVEANDSAKAGAGNVRLVRGSHGHEAH